MSKRPASRQSLGRGLSALFGEDDPPEGASPDDPDDPDGPDDPAGDANPAQGPLSRRRGVRLIAVDRLRPSPFQPRRAFDEDGLAELAESIKTRGILQPLLIRPVGDAEAPDGFEIVAGERRWRAAQLAGLHEVPVLSRDLTDGETLEVALVENLQRQDLNPMEEAEGYRRLMEEFQHGQEALAEVVGKSRSHVANMLRLLQLPAGVRDMVSDSRLSAGHARALLPLENPTVFAEEVARKGLSVRQTETLVREAQQRPAQTRPRKGSSGSGGRPEKDADTLALERDLAEALGMAVSIDARDSGGGTVTVTWRSLAQLDDILARLSGGPMGTDGLN